MSTQQRGKLVPFWRNVQMNTAHAIDDVEPEETSQKSMNTLLADWELVRRHRIDLEAELMKVQGHEKRCVEAINERLKELGVPRS